MASTRAPLLLALALLGTSARADDLEVRSRQGVTDATVVVRGRARDLYAALTDYAHWPQIFPHVASTHVVSRSGDRAVVDVRDQDGDTHTLHFQNDPRHLTIRFQDHGRRVRVAVVLVLADAARPGWSRLSARLRAEVKGIARLFVGEGRVRREREARLRRDLARVRDYAERILASAQ